MYEHSINSLVSFGASKVGFPTSQLPTRKFDRRVDRVEYNIPIQHLPKLRCYVIIPVNISRTLKRWLSNLMAS